MMSGYFVNIGELAFSLSLKNIIAFLPAHLLAVFFSIKDDFNRNGIKCFAFAPFYEIGALLALKRHRFPIVNKMWHYVLVLSNRKNTIIFLIARVLNKKVKK